MTLLIKQMAPAAAALQHFRIFEAHNQGRPDSESKFSVQQLNYFLSGLRVMHLANIYL